MINDNTKTQKIAKFVSPCCICIYLSQSTTNLRFLKMVVNYMSRKTLKALFHMGAKEYNQEYERRFNDEDTVRLPVTIGDNQAFICQIPGTVQTQLILSVWIKRLHNCQILFRRYFETIYNQEPDRRNSFLTNDIEGVHSTTKGDR